MSGCRALLAVALAACGRIGFESNVIGAPIPGGLDLESTIEMVGGEPVASQGTATSYARSRFELSTDDFDGETTYAFEVIAENSEPVPAGVELVGEGGELFARVELPASDFTRRRIRTPFRPTLGTARYFVRVDGTSHDYALSTFDVRIVVHQHGATRTRLYFPLVAVDQDMPGAVDGFENGPTDDTISGTYEQGAAGAYALWHKDASRLATIAPGAPWRFEVGLGLLHNAVGQGGFASLFDATTGQPVAGSELAIVDQDTLEHFSVDLPDAALPDGHDFEVRIRGGEDMINTYLFGAVLSVQLVDLSRGQTYIHVGGRLDPKTASTGTARALVDLDAFTSPRVALESTVANGSIDLLDLGDSVDAPDATGTAVPGGTLSAATKTRKRTPALALPSKHVFAVSSMNARLTHAALVVDFGE